MKITLMLHKLVHIRLGLELRYPFILELTPPSTV